MRKPGQPLDVLVIGGGLAGMTAAHHAALRGAAVACLDEEGHMGGLVLNIGQLDGYPSTAPTSGVELAAALLEANMDLGVELHAAAAETYDLEGEVKSVTGGGQDLKAKSVVLATGARLAKLGVPGEDTLFGRGVSQCAYCDAGFYIDQSVVVVGGGDAALQEALHLAEYARDITVVTRGENLRARQTYISRAAENPKFNFRWNTVVEEILGKDGVEGARLRPSGGGEADEIACEGIFVFVGLEPNTAGLPDSLARDENGSLVTDAAYKTSLPGVYAVGAVRSGYSGQIATAIGEAAAVRPEA